MPASAGERRGWAEERELGEETLQAVKEVKNPTRAREEEEEQVVWRKEGVKRPEIRSEEIEGCHWGGGERESAL